MKQYQDLLRNILENGTRQANRTGTDAISLDGAMMQFDMADGFPAITTKKLFYKGVIGEIIGFLRGYTNSAQFKTLGCNWWDKDANENTQWLASPHRHGEGDLGEIYGAQWRRWRGANWSEMGMDDEIDQVQLALDAIRNNPTSRRIIINAWRPDMFNEMALPPCHVAYQFLVNVEKQTLNMTMWQRSCDMFLGVPMNIFGSAMMLHLFAAATGLKPGRFTHFLSDAHIYVNHIPQVEEQLRRQPMGLPTMSLPDWLLGANADEMASIAPDEVELKSYISHGPIRGEMVTG